MLWACTGRVSTTVTMNPTFHMPCAGQIYGERWDGFGGDGQGGGEFPRVLTNTRSGGGHRKLWLSLFLHVLYWDNLTKLDYVRPSPPSPSTPKHPRQGLPPVNIPTSNRKYAPPAAGGLGMTPITSPGGRGRAAYYLELWFTKMNTVWVGKENYSYMVGE